MGRQIRKGPKRPCSNVSIQQQVQRPVKQVSAIGDPAKKDEEALIKDPGNDLCLPVNDIIYQQAKQHGESGKAQEAQVGK